MIPHTFKECLPAIVDPNGKALPADHPMMQAVLAAWANETEAVQRAWHEFCCHNSRKLEDMALAQGFVEKITRIMKRSEQS